MGPSEKPPLRRFSGGGPVSLKPPRSFAAISLALDMASDIFASRALDGAWRQRPKGWLSGGARNAAESESDDNRCEITYHTSAAGCYIHTHGVLSGLDAGRRAA